VLTFFFVMASWVNRQVMDTDEWTKTSSELLEKEAVRNALATYLVDELYANVDVAAELRAELPGRTKGLAGPAAGGLREFAERAARRALAGPRVQASWEQLNRTAHEEFVNIIKGEGGTAVSTAGGEVTLEMRPFVEQIAQRVGLGKLVQRLPEDAGQLTVLRSDQLELAQDLADLLETLVIVLLVLALGLYGLALYLSHGRRRETLRAIGLIFVLVGVLVLLLRSIAGGAVVDALAKTAAVEPAAEDVWSVGTSLLSDIADNLIVNGIIILIVAWVAGRTSPAVALRRTVAPYMRDRPEIIYGFVALLFLLMAAWGPTPAFRQPISLLIIAVLLIIGVQALRRQTEDEFPDARLGEGEGLGETWGRMRSSMAGRASGLSAGMQRGGATTPAAATPEDTRLERLERLGSLRERGILSDAEFERQKQELLGA
jgi:hypothetical protein